VQRPAHPGGGHGLVEEQLREPEREQAAQAGCGRPARERALPHRGRADVGPELQPRRCREQAQVGLAHEARDLVRLAAVRGQHDQSGEERGAGQPAEAAREPPRLGADRPLFGREAAGRSGSAGLSAFSHDRHASCKMET